MNEKIVDKIKKLLRLAESANVNEAATAAGAAQRLMEAHQIDQAMVALEDDDAPVGSVENEPVRQFDDDEALHVWARLASWKLQLAWTVASENGCRTFQSHVYSHKQGRYLRTIGIVGRPSHVATVRYLFAYLMAEIDRLCRKSGRGKGRTWANSFRLGAVHEVRKRLAQARRKARQEARAKLEGDTVALVRLDHALARIDEFRNTVDAWMKENMNLHAASASRHQTDHDAWHEGREAGRGIDLDGSAGSVGAGNRALGSGEDE
jgi:hypothetical protein